MISKLKEVLDVEYREYNPLIRDSYICGFQSSENVSIRITFSDTNAKYELELNGSTILSRVVENTKDNFDCYLFILKDIIESSKRMKSQCKAFPNYNIEDNRTQKIDKLLK